MNSVKLILNTNRVFKKFNENDLNNLLFTIYHDPISGKDKPYTIDIMRITNNIIYNIFEHYNPSLDKSLSAIIDYLLEDKSVLANSTLIKIINKSLLYDNNNIITILKKELANTDLKIYIDNVIVNSIPKPVSASSAQLKPSVPIASTTTVPTTSTTTVQTTSTTTVPTTSKTTVPTTSTTTTPSVPLGQLSKQSIYIISDKDPSKLELYSNQNVNLSNPPKGYKSVFRNIETSNPTKIINKTKNTSKITQSIKVLKKENTPIITTAPQTTLLNQLKNKQSKSGNFIDPRTKINLNSGLYGTVINLNYKGKRVQKTGSQKVGTILGVNRKSKNETYLKIKYDQNQFATPSEALSSLTILPIKASPSAAPAQPPYPPAAQTKAPPPPPPVPQHPYPATAPTKAPSPPATHTLAPPSATATTPPPKPSSVIPTKAPSPPSPHSSAVPTKAPSPPAKAPHSLASPTQHKKL